MALTKEFRDILEFKHLEPLNIKKELINLNEMILNAMADFNNQVAKKRKDTNLTPEFVDPREVIFVEADKGRISQVISNFLSNAVKFTNEGTISVTAVSNIDEVIVHITDTGTEILPRLFTKFATKSTTVTGLGLYVSKSIIEVHGSKIWGKNNYPDRKGATFGFSLPLKIRMLSIALSVVTQTSTRLINPSHLNKTRT